MIAERPRRILILALLDGADATSGGARHACGLAAALCRRGIESRLLTHTDVCPAIAAQFESVETWRPHVLPLLWRLGARARRSGWRRRIGAAMADADAVVALSPELAAAVPPHPSKPLIYAPAVFASLPGDQRHGAGARRHELDRAAFARANAALVTTPAVRHAVVRRFHVDAAIVGVAPLGVDTLTGPPSALRAVCDPAPARRTLLTVGRIDENKGQLLIARMLARAARRDWHWVVVGDGPDRAALASLVDSAGLPNRVTLIREDPGVIDRYGSADALVACSLSETFGLAIAESLAAGTPVVLPANEPGRVLSPLSEWVTAHGAGSVFTRGDDHSLMLALEATLDGSALASRGTIAGLAATDFSWDRYAKTLLECFAARPAQSAGDRALGRRSVRSGREPLVPTSCRR